MASQREAYAVLGLLPGASREDIEAMYRIRAKQLNAAKELLINGLDVE